MSYYKTLGLHKEPFSTSPDPEFFFFSAEHDRAFTNAVIELHLKRGLSVILGNIGTGKTTLSRKLIQSLKTKDEFVLSIILDPYFKSERLFLMALLMNFDEKMEKYSGGEPLKNLNELELKQVLQKYLYAKCVNERKTVVVIIDEAQKLSRQSLEMLRVMLNYETNDSKLLQLVLLGQLELHSKIITMPNLLDRISFKTRLHPLSLTETGDMIEFRMRKAGYSGTPFFRHDAIEAIHRLSDGYPRKITSLCHRALKLAVMNGQPYVDQYVVNEIIEEDVRSGWLTTIQH